TADIYARFQIGISTTKKKGTPLILSYQVLILAYAPTSKKCIRGNPASDNSVMVLRYEALHLTITAHFCTELPSSPEFLLLLDQFQPR
ncbi:MAG: hypothetical protein OEZ58_20925, partial [Gammaproteobacteria bacterium]|nr:hypothetical protein [Gammaproteobacteria bacterium]